MAYSTISKSSLYFNTKLHSGTNSTTTVTGVGFQPDMTWWKSRNNVVNHALYDAVRGGSKLLRPNQTNTEETNAAVSAFTSDGVTLTGGDSFTNASGYTYASWNWKANGSGSANTDGSINSTVSVNTTAGFSIVKYTGTGSNATVGHGLGVAPKMIIEKQTDSGSNDWGVYHASQGAGKYTKMNTTEAFSSHTGVWQGVEPTNTVFSLGNSSLANASGGTHIAYCFAEKTGYSKFGSYVGNNNANGSFIYCGFKPAFVIVKRTGTTDSWRMVDNKRDVSNTNTGGSYRWLYPNANSSEASDNASGFDFLSNGFKVRSTSAGVNANGENYIFMAFGQSLVGSNNVPCTAR